MTIAIGAHDAGFDLKQWLLGEPRREGSDLTDHGTHDSAPCHYPDIARSVGRAVATGAAERGIIVCGSGVGACIAANKIPGVRAAVHHDLYSGHQGVEHDDMNLLCLGARVIGREQALEIMKSMMSGWMVGSPPVMQTPSSLPFLFSRKSKNSFSAILHCAPSADQLAPDYGRRDSENCNQA